jgi:hypothetical protein
VLAQTVAIELKPVCIMDDAVEDGVSEGRFAENDVKPQFRNDCHP